MIVINSAVGRMTLYPAVSIVPGVGTMLLFSSCFCDHLLYLPCNVCHSNTAEMDPYYTHEL